MRLNFYLEAAGLIICIVLWSVCFFRHNVIDLGDKIYFHMLKAITVLTGFNLISCFIIRNNITTLMLVADLIVYICFWLMIWIWFYINQYLLEVVQHKNTISVQSYIVIGLPAFFNFFVLIVNWGIHEVFDVVEIDGCVQVIFNSWYRLPFILVACSILIYTIIIIKNYKEISRKKHYVFYIIPFLMIICNVLQYRLKSIAILGFGYSIVLLLFYVYVYNYLDRMDSLTGLPNEIAFKRMVDVRTAASQPMAIAMVALNDFKQVNREYGYHNGNKFIKVVGDYLKEKSPKDCIVRYGGDTYAIIFDDFTNEDVTKWCEDVLKGFENSWHVEKLEHTITASISVVTYPDMAMETSEITSLLEYLNMQAKKNKKNQFILCDNSYKDKMQRRVRIASILKEIIEERKMYVKYQPILDVAQNAYSRGEALFRLNDGVLGDIPPGEFFPIAEENGYVIEIGYVLIDKVCQYIRSFIDEGLTPPVISVNFSRQQIMAENVDERISVILKQYDLTPENIAIELSEDVFSVQYEKVKERMEQMAASGYRFYLDGFGTGLLTLPHLMELPFEIIKINKQMIRDAENNDSIYLLVSAMTAVFEENGIEILGDGIESERLKEIADMLFMNYLQGYFFSEPLTGEDAKELFLKANVVDREMNLEEIIFSAMEDE